MTGGLTRLRWFIDTVRLAPADGSWLPSQHTSRFRWGRSPASGQPAAPTHLLRAVELKLPDAAVDDMRCHPGPAPGDQSRTRPRPSLWTMTNLPAASMATLVALVNTFVTGAIAGTAYLSLGGNPSAAL